METLQELKDKKNELINDWRKSPILESKSYSEIKDIEIKIKNLERKKMIDEVNAKQTRLRELALQAYECEQPAEDVTTNDGYFHKTRVKKYPKLAALQYARAEVKDGKITEVRINGERFQMFSTKHEYGKPTEYTRPGTFEDFLRLNCIMVEDLTVEKFNELSKELQKANDKLHKEIEAYRQTRSILEIHKFQHWGLISQNAEHLYTYSPNK